MAWNSIIGQQRVKNQIVSSLEQDRLAHAYLFTGPDGVGKDATAIALATLVNCEKPKGDSCGKCASCLQASALQHPNIYLIFALPTGKGESSDDSPIEKLANDDIAAIQEQIELKRNNPYHDIVVPRANAIKVNSVREMRKQSSMSSLSRGKKVFILFDAENLRDESANALLKTLEEPHDNTLIILTTSHPDQLKATIISRCQVIKFDYLTDTEIAEALGEHEHLTPVEAASISRMANGSYTRALELLQSDFLDMRKYAVDILRTMLYKSKEEYYKMLEQIMADYDKSEVERLLELLQSWLRDTMTLSSGNSRIINVDDEEAITKFSKAHPKVQYDETFRSIERGVSLLNKNVYIPLIMLNLAADLHRHIVLPHTKSE